MAKQRTRTGRGRANDGDKIERLIFVQYVYLRRCYRNPSMDRFSSLPLPTRESLWAVMQSRLRHGKKRR